MLAWLPERITPLRRPSAAYARIHSSVTSQGWTSERTWASRTRRAMSCVTWEPKSRMRILSCCMSGQVGDQGMFELEAGSLQGPVHRDERGSQVDRDLQVRGVVRGEFEGLRPVPELEGGHAQGGQRDGQAAEKPKHVLVHAGGETAARQRTPGGVQRLQRKDGGAGGALLLSDHADQRL